MSKIIWKEIDGELKPVVKNQHKEVIATWAPQPGSQEAFLSCPVFEALYEGTRGPGKTDALIMDFAQHVNQGYGSEWRGILFRQTFPMLSDVISKTKKWFNRIFPNAKFNEAKTMWVWPTGEQLLLRHMKVPDDYYSYHGHAYPWIGWEELTTWHDPTCYKLMMSCCRSTKSNMPRKYRATTNPYGPGHNWVKARFNLPIEPGKVIGSIIEDQDLPPRVAIRGTLRENKILMTADPNYIKNIREAARNPSELAAWIDGSWDIVAGGMFDDIWDANLHVVPDIPFNMIPRGWKLDRSYDHGQSKPFSVGWWAESNGEIIEIPQKDGSIYRLGHVPGDLFRISEWYGWSGQVNEGLRMPATNIAAGIKDRELEWGIRGRVKAGPADSSIFDPYEETKSVAGDMLKKGINWLAADKTRGSRKQGWEQIRKLLKQSRRGPEGIREHPGLFICERCKQFRRTVPVLPRSDKDLDDVNTDAEDHIGDEVRYRVRRKHVAVSSGDF